MEEIRATALAYHANLSQCQKQQAREFFISMDRDGDKKVDIQDYIAKLKQLGVTTVTNIGFFKELDKDGNGSLDFDDVMSLFYLIESGRFVFCGGCGVFLKGVHFTCVDCFNNSAATPFHLCCGCYQDKKFQHHDDAVFVDNYVLLQSKRRQQPSPSPTQSSQCQPPPSQGLPKQSKRQRAKRAAKSMLSSVQTGLALFGIYQFAEEELPEDEEPQYDQSDANYEEPQYDQSDANYEEA